MSPSSINSDTQSHSQAKKKRVGKACDSCRLKKTKCSGKQPCEKCVADNKICIYTERKKSKDKVYSYDYVELIEKRLSLVNKSLLKLCEYVKLNKMDELHNFVNKLDYNIKDEITPISINQAISLLIDKHELEHDKKQYSASTATKESLNKAANNSTIMSISNMKSSSTSSPSSNSSNSLQNLNSTTNNNNNNNIINNNGNINAVNNKKLKSKRINTNISTNSTPLTSPNDNNSSNNKLNSNNFNVALSSPESLTPKSDDFSPTTTNFNGLLSLNNVQGESLLPSLDKIKEEDDRDEIILDQFEPLQSRSIDNNNNNNNIPNLNKLNSNSNSNDNVFSSPDDDGEMAMMGFNSLDLGPFHSNNQISNATINNFFNNENNFNNNENSFNNNETNFNNNDSLISPNGSTTAIPMSFFDSTNNDVNGNNNSNNSNINGCFSPSSPVSESSTMMLNGDSSNFTSTNSPIMLNKSNNQFLEMSSLGNSYADLNSIPIPMPMPKSMSLMSMSPPTIKRSSSLSSTIGSGGVKKISHTHSHNYSQHHHHSYKPSSITRTKSNNTITSIDSIFGGVNVNNSPELTSPIITEEYV